MESVGSTARSGHCYGAYDEAFGWNVGRFSMPLRHGVLSLSMRLLLLASWISED
jgi:hypothetical protein